MKPKVIIFDLETLPDLDKALKVWPQLSQWPGKTLKASITSIICAGWKELDKKKTYCINAWDYPKTWKKDVNNDHYVVRDIYNVLKDADAVVTHNGKRFDWKYLQTRLIKHGFPPLHKINHIDTKSLASSNLFMFNNKLNHIGEFFCEDKKLENGGWDLWVDVHNKEPKAMRLMEKYCKQDVKLLEKVLKKLLPLVSNMPNHNLFQAEETKLCHNCGSSRIRSKGWRHTKTQSYRMYRCAVCKSSGRYDAREKRPRSI